MKFFCKISALAACSLLVIGHFGCGDQYRPVANPIVSPGGQPQRNHYAWVVNYNPNGDGSTSEIDVSGDTTLAVNTMGVGSIAEAFPASSLALFVANSGNDTVSEYLPTLAGAITTISLLPGSHPVYLTSAVNTAMYVLNSGSNSACPNSGSVSVISTSTLNVTSTTCVGVGPTVMAQSSSDGFIYVVNQGDGTVSVFNPGVPAVAGTLSSQNGLGANPVAVAVSPSGNYVFVVTEGDGVNPGTLDIVTSGATTVAASVALGMGPTFAVVDPNLNRLYVANTAEDTVSVFDTSNVNPANSPPITLLAKVPVGTSPVGITPLQDGTRFYVANSGSNDVTVVSANSFSPLTTVPLPGGADPVFITSDPSAAKVYVADKGTSQVSIIRTSNNSVLQNISSPAQVPGCTSSCVLQQPVMILTQ